MSQPRLDLSPVFTLEPHGPETQSATFPEGVIHPDRLPGHGSDVRWSAGAERLDVEVPGDPPRSLARCRFP